MSFAHERTAGSPTAAIAWTPEAVVALGYVGVFAGAVAYVAYFGLIDATGAIRANLVFCVVPIVATLGEWALLGETISALAVVGFLTIFAGFAVLGSESADVSALLPFADPDDAGERPRVADGPRVCESD